MKNGQDGFSADGNAAAAQQRCGGDAAATQQRTVAEPTWTVIEPTGTMVEPDEAMVEPDETMVQLKEILWYRTSLLMIIVTHVFIVMPRQIIQGGCS